MPYFVNVCNNIPFFNCFVQFQCCPRASERSFLGGNVDTFRCVSLVDLLFAVVHKICIREIRAWILFCMVKLDDKVHMGVECYILPTHNVS